MIGEGPAHAGPSLTTEHAVRTRRFGWYPGRQRRVVGEIAAASRPLRSRKPTAGPGRVGARVPRRGISERSTRRLDGRSELLWLATSSILPIDTGGLEISSVRAGCRVQRLRRAKSRHALPRAQPTGFPPESVSLRISDSERGQGRRSTTYFHG